MREIEFRGKRVDNGELVYGYLFKIWESTYILWGTTNGIPSTIEVRPETVGQYTGLKDKNGVEIYEGDIVKNHMTDGRINSEEKDYIFEVVWCSSEASFEYRTKADILGNPCCVASNQYRVEVIGNIYENPNLLEEPHED